MYDPSDLYRTRLEWGGEPHESYNLVFSSLREGGQRPHDMFGLATQQLIYSTMTLADHEGRQENNGLTPRDGMKDVEGACTWAEVGMAYWMQRQFEGPRGWASWNPVSPVLEQSVARAALQGVSRRSPLYRSSKHNELTNLIGLPFKEFYVGADVGLHRAKSIAFTIFMIERDVQPKRATEGTQYAFLNYIRAAYGDRSMGHSSSEFDDGFGGKAYKPLEQLKSDWVTFCEEHAR